MDGDSDEIEHWLAALPGAGALPFSAARRELYRVGELYAGFDPANPATCLTAWDAQVYAWTRDTAAPHMRQLSPAEAIATRLHDSAMDRLVAAYLAPADSVAIGFMGGHAVARDTVTYEQVARIARELRQGGFKIVTGGGPGLMEAANFGAFMAPYDETDFVDALALLRTAPRYDAKAADGGGKTAWASTAAQVRTGLLGAWDAPELPASANLGIPTWYYGDEPPNFFTTVSGKYFANSLREDGLVSVANGGLFFAPGDAGTVQEVFQNANYNYYRPSAAAATPMVFLGIDYWNPAASDPADHRKPVFPLVRALAAECLYPFTDQLLLSDDPTVIAAFLMARNARTQRPRVADLKLAGRG